MARNWTKRNRKLYPEDIIEVWEKEPCTQAFKELMDRSIDRAKEQEVDVNLKQSLSGEALAILLSARQRNETYKGGT